MFFPLEWVGLFSGEKTSCLSTELFSRFSFFFPRFSFFIPPSEKEFFSPKKNFFLPLFKMRFSVQEAGKAKRIFHLPADAQKETGVHHSLIKGVLARNNSSYHRKSDNKLFVIQKEPEVKLLTVQGKNFFSLEEIQSKFKLSPTVFANQIRNQKFPHEIDWVSPEILSPGSSGSSSETKRESEVELLREEMQKQFAEFESFRAQMKKENELLASRVLKLEQEKAVVGKAEVAQERNFPPVKPQETSSAGVGIPFDVSKNWSKKIFQFANAFAKFCRFGVQGQITVNGPRKNKTVCFDGKIIPVADLLKEIIVSHINPQMWKEGDEDANMKFVEEIIALDMNDKKEGTKMGQKASFIGKVRKCDDETIFDISVEFMKFL